MSEIFEEGASSVKQKVPRRAPNRKSIAYRLAICVRKLLVKQRTVMLRQLGMDIHPNTQISLKAHLDRTNPHGVHIAEGTLVAFGAVILTHDMSRALSTDTYVGRNCFIGAHSIIMPGIRIGDGSIVATGSVVTKNVGPNTIVAGNPARVIKTGIRTQEWGVLEEAYREALAVQLAADTAESGNQAPR